MKKLLCLFIVLIVVFAGGCSIKAAYKFLQSPTEISVIEIVKVSRDESTGEIEQTTVSTIDDMETFLKDFSQVDCYFYYYANPTGIEDNALVIKIIYQDGEYELIDANGQSEYTDERGFHYYSGHHSFNEGEFENLISKYSEEESEN